MMLDPKKKSPEEAAFTFGTSVPKKRNVRHKDKRTIGIAFALVFKSFSPA